MKVVVSAAGALLLLAGALQPEPSYASQRAQGKGKTPSEQTYEKAKTEMPDAVYSAYRILDRIVSANPSINQKASIGIRSIDDNSCKQMLGDSPLCAIATQLPDVKKEDSFVVWALQVTAATSGAPNAYAYSSASNRIIINKPLDDAFSDDIEAKACVIAHEMAHIQHDHLKKRQAALAQWNTEAASKISAAVDNAHKAHSSRKFWTAVAMVAKAASAGLNSSAGYYGAAASANFNNQVLAARFQADSAAGQIMVVQLMQAAQNQAPDVFASLQKMDGLSASLVNRTMEDVKIYLGDVSEKGFALSQQHELEADRIAVQYMANAGMNPEACLRVVDKLHHDHRPTQAAARSTHPGQAERTANFKEAIDLHRDVYRQAKTQTSRPGALAYTYDSNMEMATIYPRGQQAASAAPSAATNVERFLGN